MLQNLMVDKHHELQMVAVVFQSLWHECTWIIPSVSGWYQQQHMLRLSVMDAG